MCRYMKVQRQVRSTHRVEISDIVIHWYDSVYGNILVLTGMVIGTETWNFPNGMAHFVSCKMLSAGENLRESWNRAHIKRNGVLMHGEQRSVIGVLPVSYANVFHVHWSCFIWPFKELFFCEYNAWIYCDTRTFQRFLNFSHALSMLR